MHILVGNVLVSAVEIVSARKDVGARQPLEAEARTISTAADRRNNGNNAHTLHGKFGVVDKLHMGQNLFLHVVVAVLYGRSHGAFAVLGVEESHNIGKQLFLLLKLGAVVVADNVVGIRRIARTLHVV